jgi:hypothetical protein
MAAALAFGGQPDAAIEAVDRSIRMSPRDPFNYTYLHFAAVAYFAAERYAEGAERRRIDHEAVSGRVVASQADSQVREALAQAIREALGRRGVDIEQRDRARLLGGDRPGDGRANTTGPDDQFAPTM